MAKDTLRKICAEITKVEAEINGVFRVLPTMTEGPGLQLARRQLDDLGQKSNELNAKKTQAEENLTTVEDKNHLPEQTRGKILAFPTLWAKGTPAERKRLLRTIFKNLLPTEKSLQIFFWLSQVDEHQQTSKKEKRDVDSNSASLASVLPFPFAIPTVDFPVIGKFGVTNGA